MNPVRDIALALQPYLPSSEGWQAASVPMAMALSLAGVVALAASVIWLAGKLGLIEVEGGE